MEWFDFSIIKYMPNLKRGEVVNIGLLVQGPDGLEVKLLDSYSKVRMLDGVSNENTLTELTKSLNDLISNEQEKAIDIINNCNRSIQITKPSTFQLRNHETYTQKVQQLYIDLVKPYSLQEPRARKTSCRLMSDIKRKLNRQSLLSNNIEDLHNHKIIPSYIINERSGITADFILKNGTYHMSSVVDFNVTDTSAKFKETGLKVLSFHEGEKQISHDIKKYFVYSADAKKEVEVSGHLGLVEGNCDEMFNMNSTFDSSRYYDLMVDLTKHDTLTLV
ncbi:DUF3037 domain-containing protein [Vibrio jasicida]|uniref:DUF3037 domain-containing protein n=1 Tax=Vibrio jasicida TaxID=766224 RepID=UPI000CE2E07B|nr:DUF3037 domain-containing protein [Vibrio jasicida]